MMKILGTLESLMQLLPQLMAPQARKLGVKCIGYGVSLFLVVIGVGFLTHSLYNYLSSLYEEPLISLILGGGFLGGGLALVLIFYFIKPTSKSPILSRSTLEAVIPLMTQFDQLTANSKALKKILCGLLIAGGTYTLLKNSSKKITARK